MEKKEKTENQRRAREHTVAGGALGALSVGGFVALGSLACPLCVVAAPALLCSGIYHAHKDKKEREAENAASDRGEDGCIDFADFAVDGPSQ